MARTAPVPDINGVAVPGVPPSVRGLAGRLSPRAQAAMGMWLRSHWQLTPGGNRALFTSRHAAPPRPASGCGEDDCR